MAQLAMAHDACLPDTARQHAEPAGQDDLSILRQIARGDLAHFDTFVNRYKNRLFRYVLHHLGDAHRAEDVTQDVFLRVFRSAAGSGYAARSSVSTWLFAIARNCAIDERRRDQRRVPVAGHGAGRDTKLEQHPAPACDPALRLILDEQNHRIETMLAQLPDEQRDVLALKVFGDLTLSQIAEVTGTPLATAKSRMRYALQKVQDILATQIEERSHD